MLRVFFIFITLFPSLCQFFIPSKTQVAYFKLPLIPELLNLCWINLNNHFNKYFLLSCPSSNQTDLILFSISSPSHIYFFIFNSLLQACRHLRKSNEMKFIKNSNILCQFPGWNTRGSNYLELKKKISLNLKSVVHKYNIDWIIALWEFQNNFSLVTCKLFVF